MDCSVTDALSGAGGVTYGAQTADGDGSHTLSCTGSDVAGNTATASTTVYIDGTPPDINGYLDGGTVGANGWYTAGPVSLICSATDAVSGVNGGVVYGVQTATSEGSTALDCSANDFAGNGNSASATVNIDSVPPAASILYSGTSGTGGWYTSDVLISLNSSDATSGVAGEEIWVDGVLSNIATGDGTHAVLAIITDNAGNSTTINGSVNIDTTVPFTGISTGSGWVRGTVVIDGTSSDGTSGVAQTYISTDGGATWIPVGTGGNWSYDWDTTGTGDGAHIIQAYSIDLAGNPGPVSTLTLYVDNTSPIVSLNPANVVLGSSTTIVSSDAGSGIYSARLTISGNGITPRVIDIPAPSGSDIIQWDGLDGNGVTAPIGIYTITVELWDLAGNYASANGTWTRPYPWSEPSSTPWPTRTRTNTPTTTNTPTPTVPVTRTVSRSQPTNTRGAGSSVQPTATRYSGIVYVTLTPITGNGNNTNGNSILGNLLPPTVPPAALPLGLLVAAGSAIGGYAYYRSRKEEEEEQESGGGSKVIAKLAKQDGDTGGDGQNGEKDDDLDDNGIPDDQEVNGTSAGDDPVETFIPPALAGAQGVRDVLSVKDLVFKNLGEGKVSVSSSTPPGTKLDYKAGLADENYPFEGTRYNATTVAGITLSGILKNSLSKGAWEFAGLGALLVNLYEYGKGSTSLQDFANRTGLNSDFWVSTGVDTVISVAEGAVAAVAVGGFFALLGIAGVFTAPLWLVAGVTAIAGIGIGLAVEHFWPDFDDNIKKGINTQIDNIQAGLSAWGGVIVNGAKIAQALPGYLNYQAGQAAAWLQQNVTTPLNNLANQVNQTVNNAVQSVSNTVNSVVSTVKSAVSSVATTVSNVASTVASTVKNVASSVASTVKNVTSTVVSTVKNVVSSVSSTVKNVASTGTSTVKNVASSVTSTVKNVASAVTSTVKNVTSAVMSTVKNTTSAIASTVKSIASSVTSTVSQVTSSVLSPLKTVVSNVVTPVVKAVTNVTAPVVKAVTSTVSSVTKAATSVLNSAKDAVSKIFKWPW
jgi:hypothetical protein